MGDGVHDDLLVEVVEVVLLDQERVTGAGQPVALGEPDQRPERIRASPNTARQMSQLTRMPSATRTRPGAALAHENSGGCGNGVDPLAERQPDRRLGPVLEPVQLERRGVEVAGDHGEDAEDHERHR